MNNYFSGNRLIKDGKSGHKSTPLLLVVILSFFFAFCSQIIAGIIIVKIFLSTNIMSRQSLLSTVNNFSMLFTTATTILLCFLWVYFYEKRKPSSLGFHKKGFLTNYIFGFLLGLLLMTINALILTLSNSAVISSGNISLYGLLNLAFILIAWIIQGASEEILIRGFALQAITAKYNVIVGIILSSIIFASLHIFNPGMSLLSTLNLILFGILAALLALYTESLWACCALHSAWNFGEGNVFGFLVSGTHASGGSIIFLNYKANNIINGGIFGPEGGLANTLISITAIAVLIFFTIKKNSSTKNSTTI